MNFLTENWELIGTGSAVLLGLATLIASKTKTKKDDKVVSVLSRFFSLFTITKKK